MKSFLLATIVFGFTGSVAFAHSELEQSMPADRAVLDAAPQKIMLHFSEPVRLTALDIAMESGQPKELAPLPKDMQADFDVAAPALDPGHYVVSWRALSDDGHIMKGEFTFEVASG